MMAQKHDVIPIIIQDPVEKSIPQSGIVALEDAETGQTVLCDSSSKAFQSKIKSVLGSRKRQRERMFQSVGVKSISLSTNDDAIQPLQSFLNQDETVNLGFLIALNSLLVALPAHYVSTSNVNVGDTFTYHIDFPSDIILNISIPTMNGLEKLSYIVDRRPTSMHTKLFIRYFQVDPIIIPTLSLTAINGLSPTELPPIYMNIQSVLSPTKNQLNDVDPIFNLFYVSWPLVSFVLAILVIVGVSFYTWWFKKMRASQALTKTIEDPYEKEFLKHVNKVENEITDNPAQIKHAYFQVTEVLFTYLTKKINMNVMDATTIEMIRLFKSSKTMDKALAKTIIDIAKELDHYKFSQNPDLKKQLIKSLIKKVKSTVKGMES